MAAAPTEPICLYEVNSEDGICTITFNRPKKANGWSRDMIDATEACFQRAANDPAVKVMVLTGKGKYYSSGADFGDNLSSFKPRALMGMAQQTTQRIFSMYINFPKPVIVAAQGPMIGGAATSACSLSDVVICTRSCTIHTPFKALGVAPEGCAQWTWPRRLKNNGSHVMLVEGKRVTAEEALHLGLVEEVVANPEELLPRAYSIAKEWIRSGRTRFDIPAFRADIEKLGGRPQFVSFLHKINAEEAVNVGRSVMTKKFLQTQAEFHQKRGNSMLSWGFYLAAPLAPLLAHL